MKTAAQHPSPEPPPDDEDRRLAARFLDLWQENLRLFSAGQPDPARKADGPGAP